MNTEPIPSASYRRAIPLFVKLAYTAFVAVLVPIYWRDYGPTNFLYFCDVALLMLVPAIWLESPLLASAPAVGILLPQSLWMVDFLAGIVGLRLTGMTAYMFDSQIPLFTRGLSFFHFWLPILTVYARVGYDRRALPMWSVMAIALLGVCYVFLPAPPASPDAPNIPVNVNYVYGMSDDGPQTWMPGWAWLTTLMVGLPTLIYLPTHCLLNGLFGRHATDARLTEKAVAA